MNIDVWTASCCCFIAAALFAILSAVCRYLGKNHQEYSAYAEGRVVYIESEPADSEVNRTEFHDRQYAVIEFFSGGHLVKIKGPVATYPYPYKLGQKLYLCYDPEYPEHYQIMKDRKWQMVASAANACSIAAVTAGCVLFLMFAARINL